MSRAPRAQARFIGARPQGLSALEVDRLLGRRWLLTGEVAAAFVLNWRHGSEGLNLQRLTPDQVLTELKLVAKSFGVFDPRLLTRTDAALIETANRVPVYRVTAAPTRIASRSRSRAAASMTSRAKRAEPPPER